MKHKTLWIFYILICAVIVWGWFTPGGIQAALANNLWSNEFVRVYFADEAQTTELSAPPPTHTHAGIFMVKNALKANDLDTALEYITPMLDSPDTMIHGIYAMIMYEQGNYPEAFAAWFRTGNDAALFQAGFKMKDAGQFDLFELAAGYMYQIDPEEHAAVYAGALSTAYKDEKAVEILKISLQTYPNSSSVSTWMRLLSNIYTNWGKNYLAEKKWDQAEYFFQLAIDAKEDNWLTWAFLAWVYYQRDHDSARAIGIFQKIIDNAPGTSYAYGDIASIYASDGNIPSALEWLEKAVRLFPDNPNFAMNYANMLKENGEIEKAIVIYHNAIKRFPDQFWVFYELSHAYSMNNQYDQALVAIQQAIAAEPEYAVFHAFAGQLFEKTGLIDEALKAYQQALILDPNNGWVRDSLQRLRDSR